MKVKLNVNGVNFGTKIWNNVRRKDTPGLMN